MKVSAALVFVATVVVLVSVDDAQAATLDTIQAGDWGTSNTWQVSYLTDADGVPDGDDNAQIDHAITVTNSQAVGGLEYRGNGSITGSGSGLLTVGAAITTRNGVGGSGVRAFTTDNTYFNLIGITGITVWNEITWTHNGDLNLSGASWWNRGANADNRTAAGSGLLTLNQLRLNSGSATLATKFTINRDLTAAVITAENASQRSTLYLAGGTTTTDDLFALGTGANEGVVIFTGSNAVLRVASSDLSAAGANTAIDSGTITNTYDGSLAVGVVGVGGTDYTEIKRFEPPSGFVFVIR